MEPTYHFKDGKVYTVVNGKVSSVVRESEFEKLADEMANNCLSMDEVYALGLDENNPRQLTPEEVERLQELRRAPKPELGFEAPDPNNQPAGPPTGETPDHYASKTAGPGELMEPVNDSDVESEIPMPDPPDDLQEDMIEDIIECPACGETCEGDDQFCSKCGEPLGESGLADDEEFGLGGDEDFGEDMMNARGLGKTVTTPNGLTGKVMSRVAGLWGDEVTVRFANGRIKKMPVTAEMQFGNDGLEDRLHAGEGSETESKCFEVAEEAFARGEDIDDVAASIVAQCGVDHDLAYSIAEQAERYGYTAGQGIDENTGDYHVASVPGDMQSLKERKYDLEQVQHNVRNRVAQAKTHTERKELDRIAHEAAYEAREIDDAIQHLVELEGRGFIPTAAFESHATEQADLGHNSDGGWLSEVVSSMDEQSKDTDYAKLMNEGPVAFVASADDAAVVNAGAIRQAATRYIRQFTSAAVSSTTEAQRSQYERNFLSRVEEARKVEQKNRKTETRKEASRVETSAHEAPDDSLFL